MSSNDTLAEEFAPGIPKDRRVQPLPSISKSTDWKLAIQEHDAERAGKHFDFRLVDPSTGHAHSWALPGARLPDPGKSVLAVPQATHTATYALNFGKHKPQEIAEGYGKGMVSMHALTDVDVHHSNPTAEEGETRLRFNIYKSTGPEEYAIVKVRGGNDILVNKTLTRERLPHLPIGDKPKAKEKDVSKIEFDNANEVMMPKYDGAHTLLDISRANKNLNLFSYREPKRHAAGLIEHTHKVPSLLALKAPSDLKGTTFRAETIAVDKNGKAIPAKDIAGMLNATVPASRAKQEQMGAELKPVIFDVVRYKGKDVTNKPFEERYELARQAGERLGLSVAELAKTPEEKRTLLEAIRAGKHPMTTEGVVLRSAIDNGPALKAKFRPDYDVHVRGIFEAKDKSGAGKGRAGGFEYSWSENGPVVGRIGTGLDHETARDMLANPDKYIGRVAKIEAEQKYPSGALGKPAFMEWHLDKGDIEKTANSRLRAAFALRELEKPMFEGGRTFEALLHGSPVGKLDLRRSLDIPAGELMVGGAYLDPSVRGLGLGRKMYGEVMRRLPGGRLTSGGSVSDDAQRLWEALKRTKGYDITPNPDSVLHTLPSGGTHRQMNLRVMNEELGKRLAGEPYRKIAPNLYTGAIAPEALLAKTAGINAALSHLGLSRDTHKLAAFTPEVAERLAAKVVPISIEGSYFSAIPGKLSKNWKRMFKLQHGPEEYLSKLERVSEGAPVVRRPSLEQYLRGFERKVLTDPKQQRMSYNISAAHEADEITSKPMRAFQELGHNSPKVILREHNRVVTLPAGYEQVAETRKAVRGAETEALRPYMNYGEGERLSRHAIRRITDQLEKEYIARNPQSWEKVIQAYEHTDPGYAKQLRAAMIKNP